MKKVLCLVVFFCAIVAVPLQAQVVLGNGIDYGGGLIMNKHHIYFIWYGNWTGNTALTILPDMAMGLDHSAYFNTMTTYGDNHGESVSDDVSFNGQAFNYYTHGTSLDDTALQHILNETLNSGGLFTDLNGIYFIFTSPDVDVHRGGVFGIGTEYFCQDFCGFHNHVSVNNLDMKYAFVGNPDRCPNVCNTQQIGPNGNRAADSMTDFIAHELGETVTDPDSNGWMRGGDTQKEVGDLCLPPYFNNTYISAYSTPNGAIANVHLGNRDFLLQSLYVDSFPGFCDIKFGTPPPPNPTPTTNMNRWLGSNGLHYIFNGLTQGPSYSTFEGVLGVMNLPSQPGTHPLYSCVVTSNPAYQFVSLDVNCEGQETAGLEGYAFNSASASTVAVYRCRSGADHFASNDPNCEGQITEGLLGYLTAPPPPPPPPPPPDPCTGGNCLPQC